MAIYSTLLFDLDNTLLDFDEAERTSVSTVFAHHGLPHDPEHVRLYAQINLKFWQAFERGEIASEDIFEGRFREYIKEVGKTGDAQAMNSEYLQLLNGCCQKKDGCDAVVRQLKNTYEIDVITNGVAVNQHNRVEISGLSEWVTHLFISEEIGCQKPKKAFFDAVLSALDEKNKKKILVVGDSLTSDIKGGVDAGLDTCYITNGRPATGNEATYVVKKLTDLLNFL